MKLEDGLIATDALTRRGSAAIIKNAGKVIATITVIIAVLLTFTDISFSSFESAEFTSNLTIMLLCSLLIYFSLEDAGERLGRESADCVECMKKYNSVKDKITGKDISDLRSFCKEYAEEELIYRRSCFLVEAGYSEEEYNRYNSGEKMPKEAEAVFKRAKRLRSAHLTPGILLSATEKTAKSELDDPTRFKAFKISVKIIPTMICMCVTVSIMLTMKNGLSTADIIESILKLSSLPIIGFRGYAQGYGYVKDYEIPMYNTRRQVLEAFINGRHYENRQTKV